MTKWKRKHDLKCSTQWWWWLQWWLIDFIHGCAQWVRSWIIQKSDGSRGHFNPWSLQTGVDIKLSSGEISIGLRDPWLRFRRQKMSFRAITVPLNALDCLQKRWWWWWIAMIIMVLSPRVVGETLQTTPICFRGRNLKQSRDQGSVSTKWSWHRDDDQDRDWVFIVGGSTHEANADKRGD